MAKWSFIAYCIAKSKNSLTYLLLNNFSKNKSGTPGQRLLGDLMEIYWGAGHRDSRPSSNIASWEILFSCPFYLIFFSGPFNSLFAKRNCVNREICISTFFIVEISMRTSVIVVLRKILHLSQDPMRDHRLSLMRSRLRSHWDVDLGCHNNGNFFDFFIINRDKLMIWYGINSLSSIRVFCTV